jgi:glycosyltransferase involved in cell wall biosynthesis
VQAKGLVFSLIIVGDGPEAALVDKIISSRGLVNIVRIPYLPPEELPAIYAGSDVLVFPTLEDVWGLVVNEALMCRTPVLVSKFAGCAQELADPLNVFNPLDAEEFEAVLTRTIVAGVKSTDFGHLWPRGAIAKAIGDDIEKVLAKR